MLLDEYCGWRIVIFHFEGTEVLASLPLPGKSSKDPVAAIVNRMEDAKGLFDTAEDSSTIKVGHSGTNHVDIILVRFMYECCFTVLVKVLLCSGNSYPRFCHSRFSHQVSLHHILEDMTQVPRDARGPLGESWGRLGSTHWKSITF